MRYCKNCGKLINPSTLVCDACGTDYNDKPKCNHLYSRLAFSDDAVRCCGTILFQCRYCGYVLKVPVETAIVRQIEKCW